MRFLVDHDRALSNVKDWLDHAGAAGQQEECAKEERPHDWSKNLRHLQENITPVWGSSAGLYHPGRLKPSLPKMGAGAKLLKAHPSTQNKNWALASPSIALNHPFCQLCKLRAWRSPSARDCFQNKDILGIDKMLIRICACGKLNQGFQNCFPLMR